MKRIVTISFIILLCFSSNACLKPRYYGMRVDDEASRLSYGDIVLERSGPLLDRWWEAFADAGLNEALEQCLDASLTLRVAYLKILDAQYGVEMAKSGLWPSVSVSAGAGLSGSVDGEKNPWDPNYSLGLSLGYEIDLWGKVRAETRVSQINLEMARDAAQAASLSLAAQFVLAWFDVQYYRAQSKLNDELLALAEDYRELVEHSYRLGQTSAVDVLEQNLQLRNLQLNAQKLALQERLAMQRLKILGSQGDDFEVTPREGLPDLVAMGYIVEPALLLERRPDIRSALRQVEQADAKIVVALANSLPSLRLAASFNLRSTDITSLFSQLFWSLAANFVANILESAKQSYQIQRAKISFFQQRILYSNVILNAVDEVEQALRQFEQARLDYNESLLTLEHRRELLELSRNSFSSGSIDYSRVLTALQGLFSASRASLDAKRYALQMQVALFKAMGGTWMEEGTHKGEAAARESLKSLKESGAYEEATQGDAK
ncbi:MAG: TolC family protein [Bradymonadales bacterium]|jgi:multidrug efflux system outer membrane protein